MVLSDSDILLDTFPSGSQATFVCSVGYTSAGGSRVVTCNAGSWSAVTLKCQKKTCGSPGEVENGDIDFPTGNEFGDKLVVKCRPGYILVGQSEILCGDKGWMGRLPTCEVVTCDEPSQITDGSFSPVQHSYNYRDVVTYSCGGLTVSGSQTVTCSEDGTFKPGPPKCIKVECAEPNITDAEWVSGSRPPHEYQATVTFRCIAGFVMEGEPTLECDINSQWTPGIPKCTDDAASTTVGWVMGISLDERLRVQNSRFGHCGERKQGSVSQSLAMEVMTQPQNAERVEQGQIVAGLLVHCQEPQHGTK
ncbi:unnamed protein product [Tetraodon nigroviridis]|uniref:(spotted green pufferfish) hypothetical protein n=1 Tax=Tetraodon nigroviridis TaxID=99883 RepID=Q4S652_TETNG|nr:unnamed protein product [Tetraodon nigroviridis]